MATLDDAMRVMQERLDATIWRQLSGQAADEIDCDWRPRVRADMATHGAIRREEVARLVWEQFQSPRDAEDARFWRGRQIPDAFRQWANRRVERLIDVYVECANQCSSMAEMADLCRRLMNEVDWLREGIRERFESDHQYRIPERPEGYPEPITQLSRERGPDDNRLEDAPDPVYYLREHGGYRAYRQVRPEPTAAETKAIELLRSHLSEAQRLTMDRDRFFIVENSRSLRRWRIRTVDTIYNVDLLGHGDLVRATYCAVPKGNLPPGDVYLTQKLQLEADEAGFLLVANRK